MDHASSAKDPNALWSLVLNKLRSDALFLSPLINEIVPLESLDKGAPSSADREYLLSELDDSIELARINERRPTGLCVLNLGTIFCDLAESYSHRYGVERASLVSFLAHHSLPPLRSYPDLWLRMLDCLLRGAHGRTPKSTIELSLNTIPDIDNPLNGIIRLKCACPSIKIGLGEAKNLLLDLQSGNYIQSVSHLSIALSAAFKLAKQLGGKVELSSETSGLISVSIDFLYAEIPRHFAWPVCPLDFNVFTNSEILLQQLKRIADFHSVNLVQIKDYTQAVALDNLFLDITEISDDDLLKLKTLRKDKKTVVFSPAKNTLLIRKLAHFELDCILGLPLVSCQLFRSLNRFERYQIPSFTSDFEGSRRLRILIVDDTVTARIVLRDYFESEGHCVIEASDGLEFVRNIERNEVFDIIFCDLTMCHMDGATAVELLRAREKINGTYTPVVLVTAYAAGDADERLLAAGFDRILRKPVDIRDVEQVTKNLVVTLDSKPTTRVIDIEDLKDRCAGKSKTMVKVLESFIESSHLQLLKLKSDEAKNNRDQLARIVHTLKGLMRDAGAKDGAHKIETIEAILRSDTFSPEKDLIAIEQLVTTACEAAKVASLSLK